MKFWDLKALKMAVSCVESAWGEITCLFKQQTLEILLLLGIIMIFNIQKVDYSSGIKSQYWFLMLFKKKT